MLVLGLAGASRLAERGHRLAQARRRRNLTQQQLAELVGVGRVSIARIEAGSRTPSMALALRIAKAVDESAEALFGGER